MIQTSWLNRRRALQRAQQIYDFIMAGSEAAGSASGIINSEHPHELLNEMVRYVKLAREALILQGRLNA